MADSLSLTTDFRTDTGCPEDDLRAIADAGFTHVHWCHHWNTDFAYGAVEVKQIGRWLTEYGLQLLDLHGSAGREKCWWSVRKHERLAGVELVKNRINMTAKLGGASVVMHTPALPAGQDTSDAFDAVQRSIDALLPLVRKTGVRLAIENGGADDFRSLTMLCERYGEDVLGLCYDCGHGNLGGGHGLDHIDRLKHRLIAIHLHDNDGSGDQHRVPFTGTVDWGRLARILAASAYRGCISMESNLHNTPEAQKATFLSDAYAAGSRLTGMVRN